MVDQASPTIGANLWHLYKLLSKGHKQRLTLLLLLMILSAGSEILALKAALPFFSLLGNPLSLSVPLWLRPVLDALDINTQASLMTLIGVVFALAVLLSNGLRLLTLRTQHYFAAAVATELSQGVYHRTLLQPYIFHVRHNSSDLIGSITQDIGAVGGIVIPYTLLLIVNGLVAAAIAIALLMLNPLAAFATSIFLGPIYVFLIRFTRRRLLRNSRRISDLSRLLVKSLQEGLGGIREVLIDGSQGIFEARYQAADTQLRRGVASNAFIGTVPRYLVEALAIGFIIVLATVMLHRSQNPDYVVPILGTLALGANRLLPALQGCFSSISAVRGNAFSLERVVTALQRPVDPVLLQPLPEPLPLRNSLTMDGVWFSYAEGDDPWVLRDLCLEIPANRTVAFVGSTGSGKSTTVDLILGLLLPQHGQIKVDGLPLVGDRLRAWQRTVAHVPQSIFLSDGSILENIAFGIPSEHIDFERARQAAKSAQIDGFIENLPAGYETFVGERGVRLSGGQRQRIGIARALYKQASVIVFDEATSALDNATEREVMAAISGLSRKITIILIAHRLTTVENCDLIFELNQGKLVCQGTFEELVARSDTFRTLLPTPHH